MGADPMNQTETGTTSIRIASPGHAAFAATMVGMGVLGLVQGKFTPTWFGIPKGFPAREALAYLCAIISLLSGIGLLLRRTSAAASRLLLGCLLVWLVLVRAINILRAPASLDAWWGSGDTALMTAAALVLYVWFAGNREGERPGFATGDKGLRIARVLYGLALIPFGVAHFLNLEGTASLVPGWLPGHTAWAAVTGAAFIAAGLAVLTGVFARLAASLSALQMGLFTFLVWVPIVTTGHPNAFQWGEIVDSWVLTAGAWVVADSYRGIPWFALKTR